MKLLTRLTTSIMVFGGLALSNSITAAEKVTLTSLDWPPLHQRIARLSGRQRGRR
jgi:hypothetical protein